MFVRITYFSVLLLVCSAGTLRGEELGSPEISFSRQLERLHKPNSSDCDAMVRRFTLRLFGAGDDSKFVQLVCESTEEAAAALITNSEGRPYAYLGNDGVLVASSDRAATLLWYPYLRSRLTCMDPERFIRVRFSGDLQRSTCRLDLFRWGHALLGMDCQAKVDKELREFSFVHESGAVFRIVFQPRCDGNVEFPVKSLSVRDEDRNGYEISRISTTLDEPSILGLEDIVLQQTELTIREQVSEQNLKTLLPLGSTPQMLSLLADDEVKETAHQWQSVIERLQAGKDTGT